jgi:hypothetical protein
MGFFLFDFALDLLLFVATTIALLASTTDPLQSLLHMLPIGTRNQVSLLHRFDQSTFDLVFLCDWGES